MVVGIPKEIKNGERRVALTPLEVARLVRGGHRVVVEKGAGLGGGFSDADYLKAGAAIAASKKNLYRQARLIVKVKEPEGADLAALTSHHILFCFLHLAANPRLLKKLLKKKLTALGFETVQENDRSLPLLAPMSEIAGKVAAQLGAFHLGTDRGGAGLLLGGAAGVAPVKVLVLGAGIVGKNAATVARGMGGQVFVYDRDVEKAKSVAALLDAEVLPFDAISLQHSLSDSDLVIGAVLVPGRLAPRVVTRAMIEQMKPKAVVVDVAIDQGGCIESSRPTTLARPTFVAHGVIHCCVPNLPSIVARTATLALSRAIVSRVELLANVGCDKLAAADPVLARAINTMSGDIIYPGLSPK